MHSLGEDGALEIVQGIVDERLAVVTLFDDDEAVAYTTMDTGAGPTSGEPPSLQSHAGALVEWHIRRRPLAIGRITVSA
ncbi:hypothetical protein ACNUDN_19885 [Mycobacterium sp. smrl_JER01]|uniref:hypothetical protein n=1 Tax=Mycobacterium sp. smrl_JER01 TaxID=3402633 RepID=UPI003AC2CEE0